MRKLILLVAMILGVLQMDASAKVRCGVDHPNMEWTNSDQRSQAGEWIWFPGKHSAGSFVIAEGLAKGRALKYLTEECALTHKEIKFNERCIMGGGKKPYTVYVRAAIKRKHCLEAKRAKGKARLKYVSDLLLILLLDYNRFSEEEGLDEDLCPKGEHNKCYLVASEAFEKGHLIIAAVYSRKACQYGHQFACSLYGLLNIRLGHKFRGLQILKASCLVGEEAACKTVQEFKDLDKAAKSKKKRGKKRKKPRLI